MEETRIWKIKFLNMGGDVKEITIHKTQEGMTGRKPL